MKKINSLLHSVLFFLLVVWTGVAQAAPGTTSEAPIKRRLAFGNTNSPIEIYVVSDWFCPSCHKMEPNLEQIYARFQSKAGFYFIDHPIHRKSANFIPYHLAFSINEKKKYLELRHALLELTDQTDDPTDEEIAEVLKKQGLEYKELPFTEVKKGTEFFEGIIQRYNINATPTLVIVNTKTGAVEKLKGSDITDKKVDETIKSLEGKKPKAKSWGWFDFLKGKS